MRGKSFVEFKPVNIVLADPCQLQGFGNGGDWANAHDFGTYQTLWLVSAELPLPDDARAWLDELVDPATWIAAGFPQPVTYEGSRAVMRPFRDVVAAALQNTRASADGSFFPAENAVLHRNLLAAYGPASVAAADSG